MVKKEELPKDLQDELNKYSEIAVGRYYQKRKLQKAKEDNFKKFAIIVEILFPLSFLIPLYTDKYLPSINFMNIWISMIFPFFASLILGHLAYRYGKLEDQKKILSLVLTYYASITVIYIYIKRFEYEMYFFGGGLSIFLGLVGFPIGWILSHKFIKCELGIAYENVAISFFSSSIEIKRAKRLILNVFSLFYTKLRDIPEYKDKNVWVYDIGKHMHLFITYIEDKISIFVLKIPGKFMKQDDDCKNIQDELSLLLSNILSFKLIKGKEINNLKTINFSVIDKYGEPIRDISIRKNYKYIVLVSILILVVVGILLLSKYAPEEKKIETVSYVFVSIITAVITALITAFVIIHFGKK